MTSKLLLCAVATLSISGLALSESLRPETKESAIEKMTKEMNKNVSLIRQQAQNKFGVTGNEVDRLRLGQIHQHLKTAENYKDSRVFTIAKRELDYANSLLQMPKNDFAIGHL